MKIFAICVVIFLLVELKSHVLCADNTVRGNFVIGHRAKNDKIVAESKIRVKPEYILKVYETTVSGEISSDLSDVLKDRITKIEIIQKKEKEFKAGRAADVELLSGGVGEKTIHLKITGQKGFGLRYDIKIYGK